MNGSNKFLYLKNFTQGSALDARDLSLAFDWNGGLRRNLLHSADMLAKQPFT